jgi:hypothetical protein
VVAQVEQAAALQVVLSQIHHLQQVQQAQLKTRAVVAEVRAVTQARAALAVQELLLLGTQQHEIL